MTTKTRAFLNEKLKLLEMKNEKKLRGFSYDKYMANFEGFRKHKPVISEEWHCLLCNFTVEKTLFTM